MTKKVKRMFGGGMGAPIGGKFNKLTGPSSSGGMGAQPSFGNALKAIALRGGSLGGGPKTFPGQKAPIRMGGMGMKKGGKVSSASKRADGCATKGKTKGKMI